ncbi:MAG TPA: response regulator [Candidatus Binataceae bacterium]|jgi:signal transduction histidine kinase/DNA-binding response OmpR family regulator|nr:response regulator [Candidatus Binataceae bacterium]
MGLASGINWPHAREGLLAGEAVDAPAARASSLTELLTINNEYWGALILRISAAVIFAFQTAYFVNELNSSGYRPVTAGLHLFNIGAACLALSISLNGWSMRYWRGTVLAMSWAVIAGTAAINIIRNEDIPLFAVTLLFATGTGCLIPWSERWQAALNIYALAAFTVDEALISAHDPLIYFRWLALLTAIVIAQLAAHLTALYRRGLNEPYEALVAAREQALIASHAKSEFLSSMSHEIRTPMNAVLGMAEVLAETRLDQDQRRYLEIMRFNGGMLMTLLDDILDLAKVESGRVQAKKIELDLGGLIEAVVETLAVRAHGKGLELVARIAPGTPLRLMGDPLRLRQVLMNLIGNAIKFTELGAVELTVAAEDGARAGVVRFTIADTGIGIEPAELGAIFSSFTQADSSDTRKYGGVGLGLAIASRLVTLMGGRIWLASEPGKGSTFHFTATLEVCSTVREAIPIREAIYNYDLHGQRALVADRNATSRRIFVETLGRCGATVAEASTVAETIAALVEALRLGRPFDLVFGDCQMPGIEQVERLARDGCTCGAKTIIPLLTTDDLNSKLARVRRLGFQHHLLKPVRRSDLLKIISLAAQARKNSEAPASIRNAEPAANAQGHAAPDGKVMTAPPPASAPAQPAPTAAPLPLRILLAEDSPDNRLLIAAYFKRLPYQVETAENGKVAVEKFCCGRYDLVLMDIQMPVMDGYTAVRTIRAWETEHRRPATPILALTASTLDDDIRRAFAVGCNAHIAKPVRKATLLTAIEETLLLSAAGAGKPAPPATAAPLASTTARPAQTRIGAVPG